MANPAHFHPGTFIQHSWDSTSLGLFKECPRKYFYSIICGYAPRGESPHLIFGIHYHHGLESYDKLRASGDAHNQALAKVVQNLMEATWDRNAGAAWDSGHHLKTRENLIRSVIWYLEEFADDPASTIILANGAPAVELSFRFEADDDLILCGHLDRVVNFAGSNYVMDRKTTTSAPGSYYFDQYDPDNQMSLYTIAAKIVYNTPVAGVIIDAAQIAVGFTRFVRGTTFRTEGRISEWLSHTRVWISTARSMAERMGTESREEAFPQNDKSCNTYGGCKFRSVCSRDPRVRQSFLDTAFEVRPWEPLTPR